MAIYLPGARVIWKRARAKDLPRGTVLGYTPMGFVRVQLDGGRVVALKREHLALAPTIGRLR